MKLNPFLNASLAGLYIISIVFVIDTLTSGIVVEKSLLIPITILSLFVLSAAVMGFLFVYEPLRLYFEGKKQESMLFFFKTVACFACFAVVVAGLLVYVSRQ